MKRHFSGKPLGDERPQSSSDDSDDEEEVIPKHQPQKKIAIDVVKTTQAVRSSPSMASSALPADDDEEESEEEESGSEEESDDDSDSESSSDDEPKMLKPVFLSKRQRAQINKPKSSPSPTDKSLLSKERTLKAIETHIQQEMEYRQELALATQNYGGIDDTDDIDPEAERAAWEERTAQREHRDREKLEKEMEELEELEERRLRTDEERKEEAKQRVSEQQAEKKAIKGAFFSDDSILSRKMEGEVEKYDKTLLPQRYRPGSGN